MKTTGLYNINPSKARILLVVLGKFWPFCLQYAENVCRIRHLCVLRQEQPEFAQASSLHVHVIGGYS